MMRERPNQIALLAQRLKTPFAVQKFLRSLPYNREKGGETIRSAAEALKRGEAHCFEATFIAAAILEHHGYPPLVVSFESQDHLDHVLYVFREKGRWGAIARSRDEGLHGRPPRFRSLRDLVASYIEPYVDKTGRITGYQLANLDDSKSNWRGSTRNVWKAERYLIDLPHRPFRTSNKRYRELHRQYLARGPMPRREWWW